MNKEVLFPSPPYESFATPELSSQSEYVRGLFEHVATIPDLSRFPYRQFSEEETALLGQYCASAYYYADALKQQGVTPLFRDDIIDPRFCQSVDGLTREIAGNTTEEHWYRKSNNPKPYQHLAERHASRQWERSYIDYMRQRRIFHATFIAATLNKESIDASLQGIGLQKDGQPIKIPPTKIDWRPGIAGDPPEYMYNRSNWLTASLLSALMLPPEQCDAGMKRHAIEQWATHVDIDNPSATKGLTPSYDTTADLVRLPWSMRSGLENMATHHPKWRQNPTIVAYLGKNDWHEARADGMTALLQDRPKDYVQVSLLRIFSAHTIVPPLKQLASVARLDSQIKDIIFAEDAAINTIYSQSPVLPGLNDPVTLHDFLHGELSPQTQEQIIADQRQRIHVLTDELARAAAANTVLTNDKEQLVATNEYLQALVAQHVQKPNMHQLPEEALMRSYGIDPSMRSDVLRAVVRAIRTTHAKALSGGLNSQADLERLQMINAELDTILKTRGLGNAQNKDPL